MTGKRFIHFSEAPLERVKSIAQAQEDGEPFSKPRGLWFSVEDADGWSDDGWRAWCESGHFQLPNLVCRTEILFAPEARILRISTPEEIDALTEKYVVDCGLFRQLTLRRGWVLDWSEIAEAFDAIIIAPYQYERRMAPHAFWYYTWDCASGCVWNARAVARLCPLQNELERQNKEVSND